MSLLTTLNFIVTHPLNKKRKLRAILRFINWQLFIRINNKERIYPYGERSTMIMKKGLTGATGNLYAGLHEFNDMAFVLHFLRPNDEFIDIGANIGSYTLLGASEIGCFTNSIEPIPHTYEILKNNIKNNKAEDHVNALNIGLGRNKGSLKFTKTLDTVNHVATADDLNTIDVPVEKFDDIFELKKSTLIKMDVEGFETEVLEGMSVALANENFKVLIIELNGSGTRYGYDEEKIHQLLLNHGFKPFAYEPFSRELTPLDSYGVYNTIYIKDVDFTKQRVQSARKFKINGVEF